jgi:hypothetical protein
VNRRAAGSLTYFCVKLAGMGATYRIVVRGEIDDRFAFLFNGMRMERMEGTTVKTGTVVDQAQLHGYIDRLAELGLDLLRIEQLDELVGLAAWATTQGKGN